ncbi:30S ribosomal protein S7 [Candidatus Amesbacteria bacterium RIFCSPHIGHO2_02_FULL_47_9]|uniref:Small ribosomal subunit protein uS7 n=1 Tax=Candidatus Amesbacteria bacterium RIFCSPHIGHO2_01_FULL_48_32b TaxID=1797253 RepID=A0A1F4YG79_9BACT|nr:MAG: 30S ribosomal protein S7 [Candidatus Amesbacteria bacterium RIFCSPHIGHO2_01_FULL_48_32b]OGD04168.1 MAG: 30S ribosomal protein S7 [Candidatus Amesbacteria bacterium RIFCSPHIGHO2_02_FULL_47_9]OGD07522.1 MAG: 30S ribosomal protein S7 [Candidatus Amesbacteria bacterium RIFCSPLOWO2_01_FULL_49_25]
MRSKPAPKKSLLPDPVYHHHLVSQLINRSMYSGKKTVTIKAVYDMMDIIKSKTGLDPLPQLLKAIENISPQMEVRARRIGGAAYQVPSPVRAGRRDSLAIRWLITAARNRPNSEYHSYSNKLAAEVLDAAGSTGAAVKKKLDTHRMAEANKAFAHFKW